MYKKFAWMLIVSGVVMFGLMYMTANSFNHLLFSETRAYGALYMIAAMAVVMLGFMWGMYPHKKLNKAIMLSAVLVFVGAVLLARSQSTVSDVSWMRAMIPHHSIAILTSERANIEDVRVRELANSIIKAQRKEIAEMEWLLEDIKKNGKATNQLDAEQRKPPQFEGEVNPGGYGDVANPIYEEENK